MKKLLLISILLLTVTAVTVKAQRNQLIKDTKLTKPLVLEPTNVTHHGFTANWKAVDNAEAYCVFVYTEHQADKDETFTVLHEDFDLIDFGSVGNPVWSEELYENLDLYTSLPNWTVYGYTTYVKGMVGGIVYTPYIDLRNNGGVYTVSVSVYGESGDEIFIESNGSKEEKQSFVLEHTGISYATFTFNNGIQDTFLHLHNTTGNEFYIDEVSVTQNLKAGDKAFIYVDLNDAVPASQTYADFKELRYAPDADIVYYDLYAVLREYNDPENPDRYEQVYSPFSDKMKVVLNPEDTGIDNNMNEDVLLKTTPEGIELHLCTTSHIKIFDTTGTLISENILDEGIHNIYLLQGLYIITVNDNKFKINI